MINNIFQLLWKFKANIVWFLKYRLADGLKTQLHRLTYSPGPNPKRIVVIGGSHGGYTVAKNLAKSLPSGYAITIVEKDRHLNHVFAFPRYSVYGGYEDNAFIPLDERDCSVLPKGSLNYVYSRCQGLDLESRTIELEDSQTLNYDYLVIATGAKLTPPVALTHNGKLEGVDALQKEQYRIQNARKIAVIGAGAVGVELASDIKYKYGDSKQVVLYSSRDGVLPRFPKIVSDKAMPKLKSLGVDVRTNVRPTVKTSDDGSSGSFVVTNNKVEEFDLVYTCVGGKANSDCFKQALAGCIDEKCGSIHVNTSLQVDCGYENVFALGDVTDLGPQMARAAFMQAGVVRDNIMRQIRNGKDSEMRQYVEQPFENALNLTLGLEHNLLHFQGETNINWHEQDLIMGADKIWQIFDVSVDNFCWGDECLEEKC